MSILHCATNSSRTNDGGSVSVSASLLSTVRWNIYEISLPDDVLRKVYGGMRRRYMDCNPDIWPQTA
ncbi:MAG: hypothetical protein ACYCZF_16895 [Anaerolineae bacterium]